MHVHLKQLFDYWATIRAGRPAPNRAEVDPTKFRDLLDRVFILDHRGPREARFRLAGTRLCNAFGMELRGMNMLTLWQGESRERLALTLDRVATEPAYALVCGMMENDLGATAEYETLYLPLADDTGRMSRILGATVALNATTAFSAAPVSEQWVDAATVYGITVSRPAVSPKPVLVAMQGQGAAARAAAPQPIAVGERALPPAMHKAPALSVIRGGRY
ncbi:PAS domain-containing protein [Futiania mangrovi]|uniref:PAS domain-containing protein n=1 Tax=Futiania mangrovi TaxID=2959716 RepID=A0A9J6PL17_9PROT|nr:PAS domain-containing protein [Futiania mangrovii]MCP1337295.1 PAS domain-containing protein [Futiania mangrovii]